MEKKVESIKLATLPLSWLESERAKAKKEGKREGGKEEKSLKNASLVKKL